MAIPNPIPKTVVLPIEPTARLRAMVRLGWIDDPTEASAPLSGVGGPSAANAPSEGGNAAEPPEQRAQGAAQTPPQQRDPAGAVIAGTGEVTTESTGEEDRGTKQMAEDPLGGPQTKAVGDANIEANTPELDGFVDREGDQTTPSGDETPSAADPDAAGPIQEDPSDEGAVVVEASDEEDVDEITSEPSSTTAGIPDDEALDEMKMLELRRLAKSQDLDLDTIDARKKDELVGLLQSARDEG